VAGWSPSTAHPEVLGVHVQLLTVEFAQLGKTFLDVVQVLDGFPEGGEHFLAMGADHGVAKDSGGAGEVPEGSKEPLGPGVDDQQPGERWRGDTSRHRDVNAPQCNCHSFSVQGAAEQMPGSWTYLARASAPQSATLTLPQRPVMSCFSSAVQCTMVSSKRVCLGLP
uniref:Uncharacterized protein n=1 Tax=Aquila chrysaetos chrysaetos TaxID=223781 RepID=A0A663EU50_AQUCH